MLKHLAHPKVRRSFSLKRLPPQSILIARELLPSDTLEFDRWQVVGIVTEYGGAQSHTSIPARALGIPYITGVSCVTTAIDGGEVGLLDGEAGTVTVNPSDERLAHHAHAQRSYEDEEAAGRSEAHRECKTLDGVEIQLFGNIGRLEDVAEIEKHHFRGVGLFRTEFLFLEAPESPSVDDQWKA